MDGIGENLKAIEAADARKYITLKGEAGEPFPVRNQVQNIVNTPEDLKLIVERFPQPEHLDTTIEDKFLEAQPEFVDLEKVVGGAEAARYNGTFLVYPTGTEPEGRGIGRVFEICKSYSEGRSLDPNKPQEYYEKDGKYYVTSGRHSTAALKALGVTRIPAMITHIKGSNQISG